MTKKIFCLLISLCLVSFSSCQINGGKPNGELCSSPDECQTKNCLKNKCSPVECRNDKTCIEHGLRDYYCRSRSTLIPSLFASECVPKRGHNQKCSHDRECISNRCIPIIRRCT